MSLRHEIALVPEETTGVFLADRALPVASKSASRVLAFAFFKIPFALEKASLPFLGEGFPTFM